MMIPKDRLVSGLGEWMRLDLFPAMPDGIARFGANMVLASFRANPDNFLNNYMPFLKMLGVVTDDGTSFDVDAFATYAREAMNDTRSFKIAGFTLDTNDINRLIGRLQ